MSEKDNKRVVGAWIPTAYTTAFNMANNEWFLFLIMIQPPAPIKVTVCSNLEFKISN